VYQRPPEVIPEPNQTNPTDKTKRTATFQPYSNLATETMGPGKPVTATKKNNLSASTETRISGYRARSQPTGNINSQPTNSRKLIHSTLNHQRLSRFTSKGGPRKDKEHKVVN
jgi:hypothetical protein